MFWAETLIIPGSGMQELRPVIFFNQFYLTSKINPGSMEQTSRAKYYNIFSIICGVWFLFTGWFWVYLINVFISFPVALIGIFLWYKGKQAGPRSKLNRAALIIHIIAMAASLAALVILYTAN
jgi:hypothetical protein